MFLIVAQDCRLALASATTVFFTIWTKFSNSWFSFCNSAKIDGRRSFQNYLSILGLVEALTGSYANKINCRCSKFADHSNTYSCWCWETRILLAKARLFSKFVWKKFLNSPYVIGSSAPKWRFCWCHRWTIALQRNKAAKRTWFDLLAPAVLKWSSHCWQKQ